MRGVIYTEVFVKKVYEKLTNEGFDTDTKRSCINFMFFTKTEGEHQFEIGLRYTRNRFTTYVNYRNLLVLEQLKALGITPFHSELIGCTFSEIPDKYSFGRRLTPEELRKHTMIRNKEPEELFKEWEEYYKTIMIPFLNECYDIKKVYNWVVQENIETKPYLYDQCLFFYFVGKMANISNEELKKLFDTYSERVKEGAPYNSYEKFLLLKNKVLKELK
ncbi:hypothetical protein [Capnocytophaga sp. oral taxon 335]|uniref:hypothetical protein n=1 Tax=Capnocytophaga sp. oral taxon 335 TaxID=712215 RepID=UPI001E5C6EEC|nr:hypothetical protein [Capnocytophaga sp. oral taxon 335]